jgi:hypothetical protein
MTHTYHVAREAFDEAVRSTPPSALVPACPAWTVRELVAHQVHQLRGALDGSFPVQDSLDRIRADDSVARTSAGARHDAWIASGVAELSALSVRELTEAWAHAAASAPDVVLDALVPDVVVHLFDLLGVTGNEALQDHDIVGRALVFWADIAGVRVPDDPAMRFEALRAITGRRSRAQVSWLDDDAAVYGWRPEPLGV